MFVHHLLVSRKFNWAEEKESEKSFHGFSLGEKRYGKNLSSVYVLNFSEYVFQVYLCIGITYFLINECVLLLHAVRT